MEPPHKPVDLPGVVRILLQSSTINTTLVYLDYGKKNNYGLSQSVPSPTISAYIRSRLLSGFRFFDNSTCVCLSDLNTIYKHEFSRIFNLT